MLLFFAIIIYILALVSGVFLLATVQNFSKKKFRSGLFIHVLFLIVFVIGKKTCTGAVHEAVTGFSFLFFICSGMILGGLAWRSSVSFIFKAYFTVFACTLLLFLFSPSRFMVFLVSGNYTATTGKTFAIGDNYFLEQQSSSGGERYKLIMKHGLFHDAIQRDIVFKGRLDSIHVLEFIPKTKALIRGYAGRETYVSSDVDSIDVELKLVKEKHEQIERKL